MNFEIVIDRWPSGSFELKAILKGAKLRIGVGSLSVQKIDERMYAINMVGVTEEYRRQGIAIALYQEAASIVHNQGGKLYTGAEVTELGQKVREALDRRGMLGNVERVAGHFRREIKWV